MDDLRGLAALNFVIGSATGSSLAMRRGLTSARLLVVYGTVARGCLMLYGQPGTSRRRGSRR
jgi:hypothetical protein